jgi:aspartyl protease family protein
MTNSPNSQEPDPTQKIGKYMMYFGWIAALVILTWIFDVFNEKKNNPNQTPVISSSTSVNEVVLKRNVYGHYVTTGTINGKEVTFLLDTGATNVSVPENLANNLQLEKQARGRASTANGFVDIYLTRINEIRIGNIVAYNVRASINPGMNHSDQILLGMSVLRNVEFTQKGDLLTLRQAKY